MDRVNVFQLPPEEEISSVKPSSSLACCALRMWPLARRKASTSPSPHTPAPQPSTQNHKNTDSHESGDGKGAKNFDGNGAIGPLASGPAVEPSPRSVAESTIVTAAEEGSGTRPGTGKQIRWADEIAPEPSEPEAEFEGVAVHKQHVSQSCFLGVVCCVSLWFRSLSCFPPLYLCPLCVCLPGSGRDGSLAA